MSSKKYAVNQLRVPSKTFLLGEYAALVGGPSLVLSHEPDFLFVAESEAGANRSSNEKAQKLEVHTESPAGRLIRRQPGQAEPLYFLDPHAGQGGFGRSTAEFLAFWLGSQTQSMGSQLEVTERDPLGRIRMDENMVKRLLADYRGPTVQPSGADLLAQVLGHVALVDPKRRLWESWSWQFESLDFAVFRTGLKVPTHDHLKELVYDSYSSLTQLARDGVSSFYDLRPQAFVESIKNYREELLRLRLEHGHTTEIVERLMSEKFVLAAKGCGSLGADVVLILVSRDTSDEVLKGVGRPLGLSLVARSRNLVSGAGVDESHVRHVKGD